MNRHAAHAALATAQHLTRPEIAIAVAAVAVILLYVMHRVFGDFWPAVIMIGGAALMIWVAPLVPHSPVSCVAPRNHCSPAQIDHQAPWMLGLIFLLPLMLAVWYKSRRGDGRGTTGTRPVFRRRS